MYYVHSCICNWWMKLSFHSLCTQAAEYLVKFIVRSRKQYDEWVDPLWHQCWPLLPFCLICSSLILHLNRQTRGRNKEVFNRDLRDTLVTFFEMIKFNYHEDDVVAPRSVGDSAVWTGSTTAACRCMVHSVTELCTHRTALALCSSLYVRMYLHVAMYVLWLCHQSTCTKGSAYSLHPRHAYIRTYVRTVCTSSYVRTVCTSSYVRTSVTTCQSLLVECGATCAVPSIALLAVLWLEQGHGVYVYVCACMCVCRHCCFASVLHPAASSCFAVLPSNSGRLPQHCQPAVAQVQTSGCHQPCSVCLHVVLACSAALCDGCVCGLSPTQWDHCWLPNEAESYTSAWLQDHLPAVPGQLRALQSTRWVLASAENVRTYGSPCSVLQSWVLYTQFGQTVVCAVSSGHHV